MTLLAPSTGVRFQAFGVPPFPVTRFTVEKFHRLIASGALDEDDPVELLRGWITPKMPHNPPHDSTVTRGQRWLGDRFGAAWTIRTQCAVTLLDSEPEPDIVVASGPDGRYDDHHPGPAEIAIVVEVADSSLARDRGVKAEVYAESGIAVYWIINLPDRQVEVYTDPTGPAEEPAYRTRRVYVESDEIPLPADAAKQVPIAVRDLLPSQPKPT